MPGRGGQRSEVSALVGEHAAARARAVGHHARAGRHFGVGLPLRIAPAVEADGGPHDPGDQVETDELAVPESPADYEVVPARSVADVLEDVLVLVGPEVVDVVEVG